jgi:hypothetical protein
MGLQAILMSTNNKNAPHLQNSITAPSTINSRFYADARALFALEQFCSQYYRLLDTRHDDIKKLSTVIRLQTEFHSHILPLQ